jgi:RimJ/RimL family protein N-acetyltransferase
MVIASNARVFANDSMRVSLRRARSADANLIWEWSFTGELRAQMEPPGLKLYADYQRWFAERLVDRQTPLWIVEDAGASIGVVLINRHDKQSLPRLTIVLGARGRGRGVGRRALQLICEQWQRPLIAEVGTANAMAVRCFEAAGFIRASERQDGRQLVCTYLWSP